MIDRTLSEQDRRRRLKLRVAAKLLVALGLLALLRVLVAQVFSGGGTTPEIPTMRVSLATLAVGELRVIDWENRPVLVYRRGSTEVAALGNADDRLLDADSARSVQPEAYRNALRSSQADLFVAIGLGTDLGCAVSLLPADGSPFQGQPWGGGFVDGCRGARYDLAGRVYRSQYADRNLVVPAYSVEGQTLILGR